MTFDANNLPVGSTAALATANADRAVVLTSKAWGHEGGNQITAQLVDPAANNSPLSVSVTGNAIRVSLATGATGAITSTAAQVIDAINANPAASALVTASKYRTNAAAGVVDRRRRLPAERPPARSRDGPARAADPEHAPDRQGPRTGPRSACSSTARSTATRSRRRASASRPRSACVRNYGTDPETTQLVDNLDIFIVPQINGDGVDHSLYDSNRRKNMSTTATTIPRSEHRSVRAQQLGRRHQPQLLGRLGLRRLPGRDVHGLRAATTPARSSSRSPRSATRCGSRRPSRTSSSPTTSTPPAAYSCGRPGAYTPARVPLPYPPYGTLNFFDQAAKQVLDGIKSYRGTAILPQQTGPVIDVLYSAAGNSRGRGVLHPRHHRLRLRDRRHALQRHRAPASSRAAAPVSTAGGTGTTNANLVNEGHDEGKEFANGNYGAAALRAAVLQRHRAAGRQRGRRAPTARAPTRCKFTSNEASSIYYTTDGSTPTTASTEWKPPRPARCRCRWTSPRERR